MMDENEFQREHFESPVDVGALRLLFSSSVKNVNIEISSFCNRSCDYCPVSLVDRNSKNIPMSDGRFLKILDGLSLVNYSGRISLNLYNEPTSDKDLLLSRIGQIRQAVPMASIYFGTNGDYLDKDYMIELANAGVSELYVTLHPPKGQSYRDDYVIWRLTELSARLGKSIKIDLFNTGHTVQGRMNLNGVKLNVFSTNYNLYGTDRAGSVPSLSDVAFKRISPCNRPFNDFTISYDGTIFPCCQMFSDNDEHKVNYAIGNIDDFPSIFHAYGSEHMAGWRCSLLTYGEKKSPCATCTEASSPVVDEADSEMRNKVQRKFFVEFEKGNIRGHIVDEKNYKGTLRKIFNLIKVK